MSAPTQLFLDLNSIDNRWKVLDTDGFCYGDGETPSQAIASARVVTNATIYANSQFNGILDSVLDVPIKDAADLNKDEVIYGKEELIEALAELGGFKIYEIQISGETLGYTMELIE